MRMQTTSLSSRRRPRAPKLQAKFNPTDPILMVDLPVAQPRSANPLLQVRSPKSGARFEQSQLELKRVVKHISPFQLNMEGGDDLMLFGLPDELSLYLLDKCTLFSKYVLATVCKTTRRLLKDPHLHFVRTPPFRWLSLSSKLKVIHFIPSMLSNLSLSQKNAFLDRAYIEVDKQNSRLAIVRLSFHALEARCRYWSSHSP